ncbi:MAG: FliM/FliN family flagellar motor switch protein [Firmicutes bacterium]|nr:FliM/FliN family flagellar motor switch protein [Bacillota bacterium]
MTTEGAKEQFLGGSRDSVKKVRFQPLSPGKGMDGLKLGLAFLENVKVTIVAELGQATLKTREVLGLEEGSVIKLDKLAGEPINLYVNNQKFACGEVLVLNDMFAVRVTSVLVPGNVNQGQPK